MPQVTVSSKYQIVIPEEIRKRLKIHKGQKMIVFDIGGIVQMVPDKDIAEMKGAFPGLTTDGLREEEDPDDRC